MNEIQLEFSLEDKSPIEIKVDHIQKLIEELQKKEDRVRKKLFAQLSELQKTCALLQQENIEFKDKLKKITSEKIEWTYFENDNLFQMQA